MPLQATSGAASYDAFGGGVPVVPAYIEEVFSTYLYTGNGSTQTITNGIDLSTKGGLVWLKNRSSTYSHRLFDTARGATKALASNITDAEFTQSGLTAFNTTGFDIGSAAPTNDSGLTFVSWTFRKQPKFFDVVTVSHTNGVADTVDLSGLGTVGCVIVKCTSAVDDWYVWHLGCSAGNIIRLNLTDAQYSSTKLSVSGTTLTISSVFATGTYIVYAYAHNAGGFGLTGTDNVISCGSYAGTSSTPNNITLGFEPQWLLVKNTTDGTQEWGMFDNMRGLVTGTGGDAELFANTSNAESVFTDFRATATGFACESVSSRYNNSGDTYIYIAIRRGPMKVPTSGTSVFDVDLAGNASAPSFTSAFPVDLGFIFRRSGDDSWYWVDRLRGGNSLNSDTTAAEASFATLGKFDYMNGYGSSTTLTSYTGWNFRRAPSTFDEVCYTGNATSGSTQTHNLGVAPEFMIVKGRSVNANWFVYSQALGATKYLVLNDTGGSGTLSSVWNDTSPTSTQFTLGNAGAVNASGGTYVAYLWATNAGVTKVGSYTGNGSSQTINCGFTGGSRLVLIIRTDASGDRYIWDSARGIVSGNDPHLSLNSTAAEVTTDDTIDTDSTGFIVNQVSATNCNVSGANYIFLSYA